MLFPTAESPPHSTFYGSRLHSTLVGEVKSTEQQTNIAHSQHTNIWAHSKLSTSEVDPIIHL